MKTLLLLLMLCAPALAAPRLLDERQQRREAVTRVRLSSDLAALDDARLGLWLARDPGSVEMAAGVGVAIGGMVVFFEATAIAQSLGKLIFSWVGVTVGVVAGVVIFIAGVVVLVTRLIEDENEDARAEPLAALDLGAPARPASMPTVEGVRPGSGFEVLRF